MKNKDERYRLRKAIARQAGKPLREEPLGWVGRNGQHFFCDQEACMVFETEEGLRRLTALIPSSGLLPATISFEEIVGRMHSGAVFAFDDGICNEFLARAMACGLCAVVDQTILVTDMDIRLTRVFLIPD